jgi:hypothetical protein
MFLSAAKETKENESKVKTITISDKDNSNTLGNTSAIIKVETCDRAVGDDNQELYEGITEFKVDSFSTNKFKINGTSVKKAVQSKSIVSVLRGISLSNYLSIYVYSTSIYICISIFLLIIYLYLSTSSINQSIYLSLSINLSINLTISIYLSLSINLSINLTISIYQSIYLAYNSVSIPDDREVSIGDVPRVSIIDSIRSIPLRSSKTMYLTMYLTYYTSNTLSYL